MLGREVTFGDYNALIAVPPTAVKLVIGMLLWRKPLRSEYAMI